MPWFVAVGAPVVVAAVVVNAVLSPDVIAPAGLVAVVLIVASGVIRRERTDVASHIVLAGGIALLTCSDGGLVPLRSTTAPLTVIAAVLAYPCIVKVVVDHVSRRHLARARDLLVDATLIGAASMVLFQATVFDVAGSTGTLGVTLPAIFFGLDVVVLVLTARSMTLAAVRQGTLPAAALAAMLLGAAHVTTAEQLVAGAPVPPHGRLLVAASIVAVAVAALLSSRAAVSVSVTSEPALFSAGHAGVVVLSVLAPPVLLTAAVVRGVSVSTSVAVASMVSAAVLGGHLVGLLRERASSEHQSNHDPLTGLPNRQLFVERLERALAHARRNDEPVGVLYVDLDRFKDVNDTFGHSAGDRLLQETARRLEDCCREEDTVARLAGDEFAILLAHLDSPESVLAAASRVLDALSGTWAIGGQQLRGSASVGVAVFPEDGRTPSELVSAADAAMYQAKDQGGRSLELFSNDLAATAATRLQIESELHDAIYGEGLEVHYQPIIDVATGLTCGAEALIRWNHPEHGFILPGAFIPVAEQSELIVELGQWVLDEVTRELVRWSDEGYPDCFATVNISSRHFRHDVVSGVTRALRASGADPNRLVIELTESAAVEDLEVVAASLRDLRELGVRAAIDDFGTGYCGLQYLADLALETLKVDRSFVQSETPRSAAIVTATIALGHSLGMTIVAEGVETPDQREFLETAGCDRLQGFLLGRPMPAERFCARLEAESRGTPEVAPERVLKVVPPAEPDTVVRRMSHG